MVRSQPRELLHRHAVVHQKQRHIADHFTRRRHLHDIAEGHVHLGICARDLAPALAQAHGFGLLLEIGVLAARHLVDVHLG